MNMTPDDAADPLEDLHNRIERLDLNPAERIAEEAIKDNIDNADSLYEPRAYDPYDDGHPLLRKTGAMREGVHGQVSVSAEGFSVDITDDMDYANYIHEGTSRIPARPFMDIPEDILDRIESDIADQLFGNE